MSSNKMPILYFGIKNIFNMKLSNEGMNRRKAISRKDNLYLILNDSPHDVNRTCYFFLSVSVSTLISLSYKFLRPVPVESSAGPENCAAEPGGGHRQLPRQTGGPRTAFSFPHTRSVHPCSGARNDMFLEMLAAVLRICHILMPLRIGSGSGLGFGSVCNFRHLLFFKRVFLLFNFWGYIISYFKIKKSKRNHKTVGIKFFLIVFSYFDRRIRIRIHTSDKWIRIRIHEAQKHTDPTDPDPQHWLVESRL